MAQIAANLGVSQMAVSLALRGRPGVSAKLRERVIEHARSLGYMPDPLAAELMSMMRARRVQSQGQQVIAFINTFSKPDLLRQITTFKAFFDGASARGEDFGYKVEAFHARAPGMTGARLAQVLQSRGVRGVILGPRWLQEPEVEMDCRAFSVVQVGYGSNIYRVCNNHVHACSLTLRKLAERGYRRIGLALHKRYESTRGFDFTLGVEQFRLEHVATHVKVDVWLYEKWTEKDCLAWIKARKVDAVVSLDPECAATVLKRNASTAKEQLGYANLDLAPDSPWSGIDQHSFEVGGTAMELLRNLLLAGERGMTPRPKQVLTEGEWRNGITTRKPA